VLPVVNVSVVEILRLVMFALKIVDALVVVTLALLFDRLVVCLVLLYDVVVSLLDDPLVNELNDCMYDSVV
jgi:hypothetical protein